MTRRRRFISSALVACVLLLASAPQPTKGLVILSWRADNSTICVGSQVSIGLYAVSEVTSAADAFVAANVYFSWDAEYLEFLGIDNAGSAVGPDGRSELLFPDAICGMNERFPPLDGTGVYIVTAPLSAPLVAPPQGALLTTFRFRGRTAAAVARLNVLREAPNCLPTFIYDDVVPNNNVIQPDTGYGAISVQVGCGAPTQACCFIDGTCANLPLSSCTSQSGESQGAATTCLTTSCQRRCACSADMNVDRQTNGLDLGPFLNCLLGRGGDCSCADVNQNGTADVGDITSFINRLLNPVACPP